MTGQRRPEWTPAMQEWLDETMSRSKPLTANQIDVIKREFKRVPTRLIDNAA